MINPDPVTNPVQTMEDYIAFLDWSAGCMPRNILDTANSSLYLALIEETELIDFDHLTTYVRIVDQKVVEIVTIWAPYC